VKGIDTGGSTVLTNEQLMNMLLLYKAESHIYEQENLSEIKCQMRVYPCFQDHVDDF